MDYGGGYDDWDNVSVGSLAVPITSDNSKSDDGKGSKKRQRKFGSENSAGGDEDFDDASNSPMAYVRRQSWSVLCTKTLMLLCLLGGGCYICISTYQSASFVSSSNKYSSITMSAGNVTEQLQMRLEQIESAYEDNARHRTILYSLVFIALILLYLRYDYLVSTRNSLVMDMAVRSRQIVDQIFPSIVRDRLLNEGASKNGVSARRMTGNAGGAAPSSHNGEDPFPIHDIAKLTKLNTLVNQQQLSNNMDKSLALNGQSGVFGGLDLPITKGPTTVKNFLATGGNFADKKLVEEIKKGSQPIADLFPNVTVFFCDIAGFTAWSSKRDPPQVFTLLETLYGAFDEMAAKLKVFKVETIGDSYMAVTGLPEPDELHAVSMARFAYQCLVKMDQVCMELEPLLGAGTEDLALRCGLHSGAVTAGVLRGQKSRFQLFGDTVNTASRMESTGAKGRIQVSQETANLLIEAGKDHWLRERMDRVVAKGKGELVTYWIEPHKKGTHQGMNPEDSAALCDYYEDDSEKEAAAAVSENPESSHPEPDKGPSEITIDTKKIKKRKKKREQGGVEGGGMNDEEGAGDGNRPTVLMRDLSNDSLPLQRPLKAPAVEVRLRSSAEHNELSVERNKRLIQWNAEMLMNYLTEVMERRPVARVGAGRNKDNNNNNNNNEGKVSVREVDHDHETTELPPPFESVAEVIILPAFDQSKRRGGRGDGESAMAIKALKEDLVSFVTDVANLYNAVPFHNFEHASHVMLATNKLLNRMTTSDYLTPMELYQVTFGISADPLTQFALLFAALVHDLGHSGVSNAQLVLEGDELSDRFRNKSVAEQYSVSLAWNLLMQPRYKNLRSSIYKTNAERKRFRQVLINAVMATDIADRGVNQMRKKRWQKAFHGTDGDDDDEDDGKLVTRDEINRKATVVIEILMQLADVAHTMQHWNIYRKWNVRLFEEMYSAYMNGRASFDPTDIWYKGETAFFDHFVIPLAKVVNQCGVFGESGGQYLTYANANRNEWEQNGKDVLNHMIRDIQIVEPNLHTSNHKAAWQNNRGTPNISGRSNISGQSTEGGVYSEVDSNSPVPELPPGEIKTSVIMEIQKKKEMEEQQPLPMIVAPAGKATAKIERESNSSHKSTSMTQITRQVMSEADDSLGETLSL